MPIKRPDTFIALDWAMRCFGRDHVFDVKIRSLRMAEEAIEAAQAAGISKEKMLLLVESVYAKPHGELCQEIGGVMLTATVLSAASFNVDPAYFMQQELRRVLMIPEETFKQRNQAKLDAGLDAKS